jgi:hypothetical protein
MDSDLGSYTASLDPTPTLLVSKLPAILFSQTQDLEPLFYPYGSIKNLQITGIGPNGTLSVLVQYHSVANAREAKVALHGQNYINCEVEVRFLQPTIAPFDLGQTSRMASSFEVNGFKSQSSMTVDASGTCRSLESYNSPGSADISGFNKRSFFATPNFDSTFCDRRSTRFNPNSSR